MGYSGDWRDTFGLDPKGSHVDGTDISSATTLTPATGATKLLIQALDQNVRITFDGTTPTATTGFQLKSEDPMLIIPIGNNMTIKVIEETATADIQYQWGV
jgi:hypothetical protein